MTTLRGYEYRRLRQSLRLSRAQAAARINVTPTTLKGIEAGIVRPTPAQHDRLMALGTTPPPPRSQVHPEGLTSRQAEMIALTWRGWSNAEIARHLCVEEQTVDNTLHAAYERLGLAGSSNPRVLAARIVWEAAKALSGQGEAA
jgi:DNA-binding NarL/FixJ family response regulator